MSDQRISESFAEMANWMGRIGVTDASIGPQPWRGQIKTDRDIIKVALNASNKAVDCDGTEIAPYTAHVQSEKHLCVAVIHPYGGVVTGWSENELIEIFKAASRPTEPKSEGK